MEPVLPHYIYQFAFHHPAGAVLCCSLVLIHYVDIAATKARDYIVVSFNEELHFVMQQPVNTRSPQSHNILSTEKKNKTPSEYQHWFHYTGLLNSEVKFSLHQANSNTFMFIVGVLLPRIIQNAHCERHECTGLSVSITSKMECFQTLLCSSSFSEIVCVLIMGGCRNVSCSLLLPYLKIIRVILN